MNESRMHIASLAPLASLTALAAAAMLLVACGNSLSGTYGKKDGASLEFHSNGKVDVAILGTVQEGTYVVEDGKVKITNGSQGTMVMAIDDKGCLDGGFMLGRLCKQ